MGMVTFAKAREIEDIKFVDDNDDRELFDVLFGGLDSDLTKVSVLSQRVIIRPKSILVDFTETVKERIRDFYNLNKGKVFTLKFVRYSSQGETSSEREFIVKMNEGLGDIYDGRGEKAVILNIEFEILGEKN